MNKYNIKFTGCVGGNYSFGLDMEYFHQKPNSLASEYIFLPNEKILDFKREGIFIHENKSIVYSRYFSIRTMKKQ